MGKASRDKGARGENEAAKAIMANTALLADRNARNGLSDTDIRVWRKDGRLMHRFEVKRREDLSIGTKLMDEFHAQAVKDGALGILWRKNRGKWRLDVLTWCLDRWRWVTLTGADVWSALVYLVAEADKQ